MLLRPQIVAALDQCFDAVVQPAGWERALEALAGSLGALGCSFNTNSRQRLRLPCSSVYRDMLEDFTAGGWFDHDLKRRRGWALIEAGRPLLLESDLTTEDERRRLPIYADFFSRIDLEAFAGVGATVGGQAWTLNLIRSTRSGWFDEEADQLRALQPSLRRLLLFATEMSAAAAHGMISAFEHARVAAVLLGADGRVIGANARAEALFGQGIDVRGGRLVASHAASNRALEMLAAEGGLGALGPVCIHRLGQDPLMVEAVPLAGDRAELCGMGRVLLLIRDAAARLAPDGQLLRQAFGLTPREVDVALLLAEGMASGEIARRLGLRASSVRQVIKAVLGKAGVSRQSALVAKLAQLGAAAGQA